MVTGVDGAGDESLDSAVSGAGVEGLTDGGVKDIGKKKRRKNE